MGDRHPQHSTAKFHQIRSGNQWKRIVNCDFGARFLRTLNQLDPAVVPGAGDQDLKLRRGARMESN